MTLSLRNYQYNVLKKLDLSYGARDSVLYEENDSLQALQNDLEDMEDSIHNFQKSYPLQNT